MPTMCWSWIEAANRLDRDKDDGVIQTNSRRWPFSTRKYDLSLTTGLPRAVGNGLAAQFLLLITPCLLSTEEIYKNFQVIELWFFQVWKI